MRFVLVEERQVDIDAFNKKFGDNAFSRFNKLKDRLKNNNVSVDIVYHTKNTSVDDMNKLLSDTENRVVKDTETGETKLNRKLVAENEYYAVYDVLDWETSMNMGDGTIWCITGRYDTGGEVKPSQAKQYFQEYKDDGIVAYLFFIPKKPDFKKWCMIVDESGSFQFWDADDNSESVDDIPLGQRFPTFSYDDASIKYEEDINGIVIRWNTVVGVMDKTKISGEVEIPEGITNIGDNAFTGCENITSVKLPSSLTRIGSHAFAGCNFEHFTIPNGVKMIDFAAFSECEKLREIDIPKSVEIIGAAAFENCKKLRMVNISEGVKTIGSDAFYYCVNLENIVIPNGVHSIRDRAFEMCYSLDTISIPSSVTYFGSDVFLSCGRFTIICEKGSPADAYAKDHKISVEYIGEQQV